MTRPDVHHARRRHGLVGPFSGRQLGVIVLAITAVIAILVIVTRPLGTIDGGGPRDPAATPYLLEPPKPGLAPGSIAPEFAITRPDGTTFQLTDLDGAPISLAALRGRGVWVNFWASWCPPCQAETPVLRDLAEEYAARGLTLVAAAVQETTIDDIRAYAEKYDLGYTIGWDVAADIFHLYKVYALPTHFFIRPDGTISEVYIGPLSEGAARPKIEAILPD
ncbi:MAG TPA: TlpA disulfide reductase family protein [Candidatus Limnocylindrales bacterium]|nr:TlpA disulfide reductase family protein [Candidatus Limnocylindrales bacterium]